jgi:hypothetical protein
MRPSIVTGAVWLLRAVGLAYVVSGFVLLLGSDGVPERVRAGLAEAGVDLRVYNDLMSGLAEAMPIAAGFITAIVGLVFLLVGRLLAGTRSGMAIVAMVLGGLAALAGLGATGLALNPSPAGWFSLSAWSSGRTGVHQYSARLTEVYSPAYQVVLMLLGLIAMFAGGAVVGCLLTPSARAYSQSLAPAVAARVPMPPVLSAPPMPAARSALDFDVAAALNAAQHKLEQGELSAAQYAQIRDRLLQDAAAAPPTPPGRPE